MKEAWSNSVYVGVSGEETIQRNAAAIGQADLLSRLLEAKYEEITEVNYDNK